MFSCKFHIIFQNKFFIKHLQTSTSDSSVAFISTSLLFFPEGITHLKLTNKVREKHPRVLFWCLFNLLGKGFRIYPICACSLKVSNKDTGAIPLFYYLYWWLLKGIRSKGLVFIAKEIFPLFHSGQTILKQSMSRSFDDEKVPCYGIKYGTRTNGAVSMTSFVITKLIGLSPILSSRKILCA